MFVMHVGRRDHCAVGQSGLTVHTNVQFHAKVPLLALAGWCISGSLALSAFFVELGAPMMVASTMVTERRPPWQGSAAS